MDSYVPEDMSVCESNSTAASVDTAEGQNAPDDTDLGPVENLQSANDKEDWAVIYTGNVVKTVGNIVSTESEQTGTVDDSSDVGQEVSLDNKTINASSLHMSNNEKTGKVEALHDQEDESGNGNTLDLNFNQNHSRDVRNLNETLNDSHLDENYNVHIQGYSSL